MSPAAMKRAIGASAFDWEGPVLEGGVEGVEEVGRRRRAVGDQLPGHVVTAHEPGGDGVDRGAPAVGGEVGAGDLEHPGAVVLPVEGLDVLRPVAGDVLGVLEVLGDQLAGEQRRVVDEHQQQQHAHAGQDPAVGERRAEHLRTVRVAGRDRRPRSRSARPGPAPAAAPHRGMLRMAPPACEVCSSRRKIAPSTGGLPHGCAPTARIVPTTTSATKYARWRNRPRPLLSNPECGEQQRRADQPQVLGVGLTDLDELAVLVAAVEEPVAEAAQHLVRRRRARRRS